MKPNRLSPGSWIAHSFSERELRGEAMSIEFLRAALESAPYPEAWTRQEGADFAAAYLGGAS